VIGVAGFSVKPGRVRAGRCPRGPHPAPG